MKVKYRSEIDGLRAFAVVTVILFHAGFELFSGGFVGVDVFFVISGYLITTILIDDIENSRFSIVNFYERRVRRILPALFFVMLVCIPFAWMWMLPSQIKDFSQSLVAVSLFASNILFWRETGYFAAAAEEKPLLHTWSLAVEEQYYVLFPIFLFFAWRFGKNRVFWMIVVFAAISLALSEWGWRNKAAANFYLAPTRAWEIFAGSIAAFIVQKRGVQASNILSMLGLAAIIFAIFAYDENTPFPSMYALVPVIGVVLLILFAEKETLPAKLLSTKVFVGIGLISYSLYLWHQPVFAFARIRSLDSLNVDSKFILIAFLFVLSFLSWKFVEQPFRKKPFRKNKLERKNIFTATIVLSLSLFVVSGLYHIKVIPNKKISLSWMKGETELPNKFNGIFLNGERCSGRNDPYKSCVIGNIDSPTLIIIGDSHARVLTEAAQYYAKSTNFRFVDMSTSGCPLMPLLNVYSYGTKLPDCDSEYQSQRMDYLTSLPPSIVLIHSRYSLYLHGGGFDNGVGGTEPTRSFYAGISGQENFVERKQLIYNSLVDAVKVLLDSGHRVIFVGGVPTNGWHPINRLAKIESIYGYGVSEVKKIRHLMSVPLGNVEKRQQDFSEIIKGIVNEFSQVSYIGALPIFCKNNLCNSVDDEMRILYSDIDHLSFEGAKKLFRYIMIKVGLH